MNDPAFFCRVLGNIPRRCPKLLSPALLVLFFSFICLCFLLSGCAHLQSQPFTFVQMSDPQIGFTAYEQDLARFNQAVERINSLRPDFVVICGDLVNHPDRKSWRDFRAAAGKLKTAFYCAPGNHDVGNKPTTQSLRDYRKAVGRDHFSFEHKGCTFLVLNTQIVKSPVAGETEKQDAWLRERLAAAHANVHPIFIVEHYPPFVKAPDEPNEYFNLPPEPRRELLTLFERSGVVAILAGHTHTTLANQFGRFQIVTSETTSRNFDKRPYGFTLWQVSPNGSCHHQFVPLE